MKQAARRPALVFQTSRVSRKHAMAVSPLKIESILQINIIIFAISGKYYVTRGGGNKKTLKLHGLISLPLKKL